MEDVRAYGRVARERAEALLAGLVAATGDPDVAVEALGEALAAGLLELRRGDEPDAARLDALAREQLAALHAHGEVPDDARRRLRLRPLALTPAARVRVAALAGAGAPGARGPAARAGMATPAGPGASGARGPAARAGMATPAGAGAPGPRAPSAVVLVERPDARPTDDPVADLLAGLEAAVPAAAGRARSRRRAALAAALVAVLAAGGAALTAGDDTPSAGPSAGGPPGSATGAHGAAGAGDARPRRPSPAPVVACAPSPALLEALPALGAPRGVAPPAGVGAAAGTSPEVAAAWARRWAGGETSWWVVPRPTCGPRAVASAERACLVRVAQGAPPRRIVCAGLRRLRGPGAHAALRLPGRVVLSGFAPAGATLARVRARGRGTRTFAVVEGVFLAVPPGGATTGLRLAFR